VSGYSYSEVCERKGGNLGSDSENADKVCETQRVGIKLVERRTKQSWSHSKREEKIVFLTIDLGNIRFFYSVICGQVPIHSIN